MKIFCKVKKGFSRYRALTQMKSWGLLKKFNTDKRLVLEQDVPRKEKHWVRSEHLLFDR